MKYKVVSLNSIFNKVKLALDKALLNMDKESVDDFVSSISFMSFAGTEGEASLDYIESSLCSHINGRLLAKGILLRELSSIIKISQSGLMVFCQKLADVATSNINLGDNPTQINEVGKESFNSLILFLQRVNNSDDPYFYKMELGVISESGDYPGALIGICLEALGKQLSVVTLQEYRLLLQGNIVFKKALTENLHAIFDRNPKMVKYWAQIALETGYANNSSENTPSFSTKQFDSWLEVEEKDYTTEMIQEIFKAYSYFQNEDNFKKVAPKKRDEVSLFINWCKETLGFLGSN